MGLDFHGAALLSLAWQQRMPMQTVLTLGRQDSDLSVRCIQSLMAVYGAPVGGADCKTEPYGEAFFKRLGAQRVDSLDFSPYQGCSVVRDLNEPPPDRAAEQYDLVYDGGTLEHVFHFPNAIANCMSLVKVGGHFMCSGPANQWLGHGFYQFSPELFFRVLSPENGFEMVRVFLAEHDIDRPGKIYGVVDPAETGVRTLLESAKPMSILVWAKKTAETKPFQSWPKQSDYTTRWAAGTEGTAAAPAAPGASKTLRKMIGQLIPDRIKASLAWKKHLASASRGLVTMRHMR